MEVTKDEAWKLAKHWVAAWNAHDLELILTHYEDGVELTSPVAAQLLGTEDGKVLGKANSRAYFERGLTTPSFLSRATHHERCKDVATFWSGESAGAVQIHLRFMFSLSPSGARGAR